MNKIIARIILSGIALLYIYFTGLSFEFMYNHGSDPAYLTVQTVAYVILCSLGIMAIGYATLFAVGYSLYFLWKEAFK